MNKGSSVIPRTVQLESDRPRIRRLRRYGKGISGWLRRRSLFLISIALIGVVWEVVGRTQDLFAVPPLTEVLRFSLQAGVDGTIAPHLASSLTTLVIGLVIAIVMGVLVGALMAIFPAVHWAMNPYVSAGLSAPLIAFVPVFIVIFGLGRASVIATVVLYSIFTVIVNTEAGIRTTDRTLISMARSFGAGGRQLFWRVRLPAAGAFILVALEVASNKAVKGLIAGEVLIAVVGLGGLVHQYGTAFSMTQLFGLIFYIIALAFAVQGLVRRAVRLALPAGPTVS